MWGTISTARAQSAITRPLRALCQPHPTGNAQHLLPQVQLLLPGLCSPDVHGLAVDLLVEILWKGCLSGPKGGTRHIPPHCHPLCHGASRTIPSHGPGEL